MDKLSVEVDHSKESLERRTFYWMRKLRDGGAVLLESVEPLISAKPKDLFVMILMRNQILRIDENIIQVDKQNFYQEL